MNIQSNQLALASSFNISLLSKIQDAMNECEIPFKIEEFTLKGNMKGFNLFVEPENLKVTLALVEQVEFPN
ncbi:MAG TPA: hypothetical protein VK203_10805 [Nostocaceae cyanobacterium]|nr:hypothetical protein [Nostocaceae cyanobacterium]